MFSKGFPMQVSSQIDSCAVRDLPQPKHPTRINSLKACMNHIYRIVWNTATACYQAVTESAKGQGKSQGASAVVPGNSQIAQKTAGRALTATALGAALYTLSQPGFAGPAGGQVTAGSATINQAGSATTINQTSNKAAIDWAKFSVGSSESVRFNQPGASSITLNRVTGAESSAIMG